MTQADSVDSTPRITASKTNPSIDHARRRFLAVAAGASAASVGTLAVAAAKPAAVAGIPTAVDPIYAAIERHRSAASGHDNAVNAKFGFEAQCGGCWETR